MTDVDRACEAAILDVICSTFPDHAVLAEESGARGEHEFLWLVDPLDGTTNFAHGYPQVAISLALRRGAQTILGVVYDPIREELFVARRGGGAFLNDRPLRVSVDRAPGLVARSPAASPTTDASMPTSTSPSSRRFMLRTQGIRRAGSAALDLCWVAAGRVDGFWEWKLKPWDTAAGALLVEEAGGRVSDFRGGRFRRVRRADAGLERMDSRRDARVDRAASLIRQTVDERWPM